MPEIRAFRALRYNPETVPDLARVVAPPYDVISPARRAELAGRDPRNVVAIDLPVDAGAVDPDEKYRQAARTFAAWRSDGTLRKDRQPSLYVYEQAYVVPGTTLRRVQRGFYARLRLEAFGPGSGVLPHERTLAGPKEDRYKLMRATGANFSGVMVLYADPTGTADYEGELAVVIGAPARGVPAERALGHVFGYTIVNDVTARHLQKRHVQWFVGKGPDTFCPMGPCITTADELPDIGASWLRTRVNGELRQEAPISALIFGVAALIATLSGVMTLEPGDVIATGTPVGAGLGFDPPRYLRPGDVVEVEIDGIGTLRNPVV